MTVPKALFQLKKIPDPDHYIEAIVRNIPNKYCKKADNYLQFNFFQNVDNFVKDIKMHEQRHIIDLTECHIIPPTISPDINNNTPVEKDLSESPQLAVERGLPEDPLFSVERGLPEDPQFSDLDSPVNKDSPIEIDLSENPVSAKIVSPVEENLSEIPESLVDLPNLFNTLVNC